MAAATAQKTTPASLQTQKGPERVVYQLLSKNKRVRADTPIYPPYILMKNVSLAYMDGMQVNLRYIKGHKSIRVDEQEEGNRVLPPNMLNNKKNEILIIDGKIEVSPTDTVLIKYLDSCSENADSPYRIPSITPRFRKVSEENVIKDKESKQEKVEQALELAKSALEDPLQLRFHAKHLGVEFIDAVTGASRSDKAIRVDYKQAALDNPEDFIKSFNDIDLKVKFWIEKAVDANSIDIHAKPNVAIWSGSKTEICSIPSGTDRKNILQTLFEFANKQAGQDFMRQLRDKNDA